MKKKISCGSLLFFVLVLFPYYASAMLWTGELQDVQGSVGVYSWGDGINNLRQQWSINEEFRSGWFYGSHYSISNADVYVYSGLSDPTTITDASGFDYHDSSTDDIPSPYGLSAAAWAQEGDTVFFRGENGYYGAWYIEDIYYYPSNQTDYAALAGTWYFLDDGSADFSAVPIPGAMWLLSSGLLGMVGIGFRRKR